MHEHKLTKILIQIVNKTFTQMLFFIKFEKVTLMGSIESQFNMSAELS